MEERRAKRNSKNRPAGTMLLEPVSSVKKEDMKRMVIDKVFPAIRESMPHELRHKIIIQQDNASPHKYVGDPEVVEASKKDGWNIEVRYQPSNSPDLNILDLGFFNAIQSVQHTTYVTNYRDLVNCVVRSYWGMSSETINKTF